MHQAAPIGNEILAKVLSGWACSRQSLLDEELHQPVVPLEEIDVHNLDRVTPSYCVLPSQCVEFYPSRSLLARSVLNNSLVAISTGTEDTETVGQCASPITFIGSCLKERRSNSSELRIVDVETEIWATELKIERMKSLLKVCLAPFL